MSQSSDISRGSPDRFGYEWSEYTEIRPEYETQFRRWTPFLSPQDWAGKDVLDVGCGMGRNTYWPLSYGAASGTAIDVDPRTLASARKTLSRFSSVAVREASAYEIPFKDRFDVAYSIGVIHHLEFPERALQQMREAVRPGGRVMIWVYGYENNEWIVKFFDPLRKLLFSRLPISVVHHLALYPSALVWLVVRTGLSKPEYLRLIRTFAFRHLRSIVFDQMLPHIANYWKREEVAALMRGAGLEDVKVEWVNEMSWSAIGTRPRNNEGAAASSTQAAAG